MNSLNSLLDVYHIGSPFLKKVNQKRALLNKGIEFSFFTTGSDFNDRLNQEMNIRFLNSHTSQYSFKKDVWVTDYFSQTIGGRFILFSNENEKINLNISFHKSSEIFILPINSGYQWFNSSDTNSFVKKYLNDSKKEKITVVLKAENLPMHDSFNIDSPMEISLFKKFLVEKAAFSYHQLNKKNMNTIEDFVELAKLKRANYSKIIKVIDNFIISKDISFLLNV